MSTRLKVGFVAVLSCLVSLLSLFFTTGIASAHSAQKERPADGVTWSVQYEGAAYTSEFANHVPTDSSMEYLVVNASVENVTNNVQTLQQPLWNVADSFQNTYSVTDSTQQLYLVGPFQTIETQTAFIVPISGACPFTISLTNSVNPTTHTMDC